MRISEVHKLLLEGMDDDIRKKNNLTTRGKNSTGFNEEEQAWYGWSHRAVCSFKIGDKIFEPDFGDDSTKFSEHGSKPIKTLDDAKLAAERFSDYVS